MYIAQRGAKEGSGEGGGIASRIKNKEQLGSLKLGLPEDLLFLSEMICYIGTPRKSLCAFYTMHEKRVINLALPWKNTKSRQNVIQQKIVWTKEQGSSIGSLTCKNVCNISYQKRKKVEDFRGLKHWRETRDRMAAIRLTPDSSCNSFSLKLS